MLILDCSLGKPYDMLPVKKRKDLGPHENPLVLKKYTHTHIFFPSGMLPSIRDDILNGVAEVFFFLSCTLLFLDNNASP